VQLNAAPHQTAPESRLCAGQSTRRGMMCRGMMCRMETYRVGLLAGAPAVGNEKSPSSKYGRRAFYVGPLLVGTHGGNPLSRTTPSPNSNRCHTPVDGVETLTAGRIRRSTEFQRFTGSCFSNRDRPARHKELQERARPQSSSTRGRCRGLLPKSRTSTLGRPR